MIRRLTSQVITYGSSLNEGLHLALKKPAVPYSFAGGTQYPARLSLMRIVQQPNQAHWLLDQPIARLAMF
jgi:hypothetical protein